MATWQSCWINLKDENAKEMMRLAGILKRTNKDRVKKKLGKGITKLRMS